MSKFAVYLKESKLPDCPKNQEMASISVLEWLDSHKEFEKYYSEKREDAGDYPYDIPAEVLFKFAPREFWAKFPNVEAVGKMVKVYPAQESYDMEDDD
jgi:hypothetical protein